MKRIRHFGGAFRRMGPVSFVWLIFFIGSVLAADHSAAEGGKKELGARTLASPCPVWVIGSYDAAGKPNVMTASWTGICCSKPPCIAVSLRAATHTHGNIMAARAFTVNVPSEKHAREAAFFGSASGRDTDKFAATGMTPVRGDSVDAPYVKEFPLVIECRVREVIELGLHTMFVGEIVSVKADESILNAEGAPDMAKLRPILFGPGNESFFGIGAPVGSMRELLKDMKR